MHLTRLRPYFAALVSFVALSGCQSLKPSDSLPQPQPEIYQPEETELHATKEADPFKKASTSQIEAPEKQAVIQPKAKSINPKTVENLWDRIALQMQMPYTDNSRIETYRKRYLNHPRHFQMIQQRAEPFLFVIVEAIEEKGLPLELALLPVVESAFDPYAYSAGGAAGLWQFISPTAKRFGLAQDWWYDGRRDVVASTQTAIKFLTYLHKRFDGNWLYALAAYNTGEGRVRAAIRKNKKRGKPTDFWNLDLPRETRGYVPKWLALVDLIKHAEQHNLPLPAIHNSPYLEVVEVKEQIALTTAAKWADLSMEQFLLYNPAFKRWATGPKASYPILVPTQKKESFKTAVLNASAQERLNLIRYKIQSGDSLISIAKKFNTTPDVLKRANQLSSHLIRKGKHLLVPVGVEQSELIAQNFSHRQMGTRGRQFYRVQSGDSLWSISRQFKVGYEALAKWNSLSTKATLRPGQRLVILNGKGSTETRKVIYKIRRGDSLSTIADRFKVRLADLLRWNRLNASSILRPGQKLRVMVNASQV